MPSIYGWGKADVIALSNLIDINVSFTGYGYVKNQSIEKNTNVDSNMTLEVTLESDMEENV
jgi:hypothetical protein